MIGMNVFTGFTIAGGFLHIDLASGGLGWLKSDTMSVGPQLLVCLPVAGVAAHSIAGAVWLTGLTGVGCLIVKPCWATCSIDDL